MIFQTPWWRRPFWLWIFFGLFFVAGFVGAWYIKKTPAAGSSRGAIIRQNPSSFRFISPILGCEIADETEFNELAFLKKEIERIIQERKIAGAVQSVAVYFRALRSGRWIGVNEDEKFSPASMLKVPVMMAYFKLSENAPEILDKKLVYRPGEDLNAAQVFKSAKTLTVGNSYTVRDLLRQMIINSDNNTQYLLKRNLPESALFDVYSEINLPLPKSGDDIDFMTTKEYAFLFRILFGATYLNREYSEQGLALLAESDFKDGLIAGLPVTSSTPLVVAHKFGERSIYSTPEVVAYRELHDCGIIYYPDHPYELCVMTKGKDFGALMATISEVSHTVFNQRRAVFSK